MEENKPAQQPVQSSGEQSVAPQVSQTEQMPSANQSLPANPPIAPSPEVQPLGQQMQNPEQTAQSQVPPLTQPAGKNSKKKLLIFVFILILLIVLVFVYMVLPSLNNSSSNPSALNPTATPTSQPQTIAPSVTGSQSAEIQAVDQIDPGNVNQDLQSVSNDANQL